MPARRAHPCLHRAVAAAMAVAALLVGSCFTNKYNRYQTQARYARSLAPAEVDQRRAEPHTEVRTLRVRAWADAQYRSQVMRWDRKLALEIARVNKVLGPAFGVELELVDTRPWERDAPANDLMAVLSELEQIDPADDVDWVIGLITQLPEVSSSLHLLGAARPLSPYMVVRGTNDVAERKTIDEVFDELDEQQRDKLFAARKRHKELVLFLHEWAHTLGAMHTDKVADAIMNPGYSNEVSRFSPPNAALIEIALRYRGRGSIAQADRARMRTELLEHVRAHRGHWFQEEVGELIRVLDQAGQPPQRTAISANLTPRGRKAYYRAMEHVDEGRWSDAFDEILPLTEQYEDEPRIQAAGCRISARARGADYPTEKLCARAAELDPGDATPALAIARIRFAAKDDDAGLAALRRAHAALDRAGDRAPREQWLELADSYQRLGAITWLEQALDGAGGGDQVDALRAWATQTRRRYGVPPNGAELGIPPEREGEYLELVKQILSLTYASKYKSAQRAAKRAQQAFPKSPGVLLALCDFNLRIGKNAAARRACDGAIAAYDEAMWAHYLAGSIAARAKRHERAIRHLKRALELDPEMRALWKLLAQTYEAAGEDDALRALEADYTARFGAPL